MIVIGHWEKREEEIVSGHWTLVIGKREKKKKSRQDYFFLFADFVLKK
jgi:hypothetical protein